MADDEYDDVLRAAQRVYDATERTVGAWVRMTREAEHVLSALAERQAAERRRALADGTGSQGMYRLLAQQADELIARLREYATLADAMAPAVMDEDEISDEAAKLTDEALARLSGQSPDGPADPA